MIVYDVLIFLVELCGYFLVMLNFLVGLLLRDLSIPKIGENEADLRGDIRIGYDSAPPLSRLLFS